MRKEYKKEDLGKGVRGKYLKEYQKGSNIVLIRPEVSEAFPDEESVNNALLSLIEIAKKATHPTKQPTKPVKKTSTKLPAK